MAAGAAILMLNQQTIRNMIDRGELGWVRVGPRRVRIRQSRLDAFLAAGEANPQAAEADPWQAVSDAVSVVTAAVRAQDRVPLDQAISGPADAAQDIPSATAPPGSHAPAWRLHGPGEIPLR
ncbi:MAG: helix-turn-helix domain-containing protein [Solirubrobacteraceae bacterium]